MRAYKIASFVYWPYVGFLTYLGTVIILRDAYGTSLPLNTQFDDVFGVFPFLILALIGSVVLNCIHYFEKELEKLHSDMPKAN